MVQTSGSFLRHGTGLDIIVNIFLAIILAYVFGAQRNRLIRVHTAYDLGEK